MTRITITEAIQDLAETARSWWKPIVALIALVVLAIVPLALLASSVGA